MDANIFNSLLDLLPEDRKDMILSNVRKIIPIAGFQKGHAPKNIILRNANSDIRIQTAFLESIFLSYYPGEKIKKTNPDQLGEKTENLPGILACLFIKKPGSVPETWNMMQTEIEKYLLYRNSSTSETDNNMIDNPPDEISSSIPENIGKKDDITAIKTTETNQNGEEVIMKSENENEMFITPKIDPNNFDGNEYLGYVQVYHTANGGTYYNFYPLTEIDVYRGIFIQTPYEIRIQDFPMWGNINIFTSNSRAYDLARNFKNGRLYILSIDQYFTEENYNSSGTLNQTQLKIDLKTLVDNKLLHNVHDEPYFYYQVFTISNLQEKINSGKPIILEMPQASITPCEYVMLKDSDNQLVGPFAVKEEKPRGEKDYVYSVNPEPKKNHYLFDVYDGSYDSNSFITITYEGSREEASSQTTLVNLSKLPHRKVDFVTNDLLIEELKNLYEKGKSGDIDFSQSVFLDADIPHNIITARTERMNDIIKQNSSQIETVDSIMDLLAKSVLDKVQSGDPLFDDIVNRLIENTDFMNGISSTRILSDAIQAKQDDYDKFSEIIEEKKAEKQSELDGLNAELSQKRAEMDSFLEEAHKKDQENYEDLQNRIVEAEEKLKELTEKLSLVNEIGELRVQLGIEERLLEKTKADKTVLEQQTNVLTKQFKTDADEALSRVADLRINEEIAKILSSAATDSETELDEDSDTVRLLEHLSETCLKLEKEDNLLPNRLADFFKEFRVEYRYNDIINLYICFTQGFLTVFSGAPGTGKTSACTLLTHSLGLDISSYGDSRFITVPVERGWSSKRDLIGYYNPLSKEFDKSNQSVFRALEISDLECKNGFQGKLPPMAILLDEANLSQMEYYWASFMNIGDRSTQNPQIDLGNGKVFHISNSLRFLATINNDHTTESLSPRLIDRAWVITLPNGRQNRDMVFSGFEDPVLMDQLQRVFGSINSVNDKQDPYSDRIFDDLYKICNAVNLDVSVRTKGIIKNYCLAGASLFKKDADNVNRNPGVIAADYAISQKILPKIQGQGPSFKENVLDRLKDFFAKNNLTKSDEILDRIIETGNENMYYYRFFG